MNTQSDADEPQDREHGGGARKDDALLDDPRAVRWLEDYTKLLRALTDAENRTWILRSVLEDILRDLVRAYDDPRLALSRADIRAHIRAARRALGMVDAS